VLTDARFNELQDRDTYAEHCTTLFKTMGQSLTELATEQKLSRFAVDDFRRYKAMQKWYLDVGDVLAYFDKCNAGANLRGAVFSVDGQRIATASFGRSGFVFNSRTGQPLNHLRRVRRRSLRDWNLDERSIPSHVARCQSCATMGCRG
jgi:hypothetical protein